MLARSLLGPMAVGAFAGVELAGHGVFRAAAGAYFVFAVAQIAVDFWSRWQLQVAQRRLAVLRSRRGKSGRSYRRHDHP
jgi:hypothetical protein